MLNFKQKRSFAIILNSSFFDCREPCYRTFVGTSALLIFFIVMLKISTLKSRVMTRQEMHLQDLWRGETLKLLLLL